MLLGLVCAGIQDGSIVELLEGLVAAGESLDALLAEEGMSLLDLDEPYQLMFGGISALKSALACHQAGVVVGLDYFEKHRYVMRSRWQSTPLRLLTAALVDARFFADQGEVVARVPHQHHRLLDVGSRNRR